MSGEHGTAPDSAGRHGAGQRWDVATVLALAPDPASQKAARKLWNGTGWSGEGCTQEAVWGQCAGSGKTPYTAVVDLTGPAYRCSCPSRKFPCKHALALLLRWSDGTVTDHDTAPGHVRDWFTGRVERVARAATRAPATPDPKTAERRRERITGGVSELQRWLEDVLGTGLGTVRGQGTGPFDRMAARLVDAQAPGLAGWVRRLPQVMLGAADWADRLTTELGLLHLLTRAHDQLESLDARDAALAATVREYVGYPLAREAVLAAAEPVRDHWGVYAVVDAPMDRIWQRTVYLQGAGTGRDAVLLFFGPSPAQLEDAPAVGTRIEGDLAFYPGAVPGRALVRARQTARAGVEAPATGPVAQVLAARAAQLTRVPWLGSTRHWVRGVLCRAGERERGEWVVLDADGAALPLTVDADPWQALVHTRGEPASFLLDWGRDGCRPVAAVAAQGLVLV